MGPEYIIITGAAKRKKGHEREYAGGACVAR
jgi:hypothetical protein